MIRSTLAGHFLPSRAGRIFLLVRSPPEPQGSVLVVPPFAEEMNKCRRMVTEVALELCSKGHAVLVPDLFGTGDSQGDFAEGRWELWQEDLERVCAWADAHGLAVRSLIAIRLGAALAISAARNGRIPAVAATAFWQPVLNGEQHLTQFLRMRTAGNLMAEGKKESVADLRAMLSAGQTIEVAGYELSGELAADLDAVTEPTDVPPGLGALYWMEVVRTLESGMSRASSAAIQRLQGSGERIHAQIFVGEPFWATVEITCNPEMIRATARSLCTGAWGRS